MPPYIHESRCTQRKKTGSAPPATQPVLGTISDDKEQAAKPDLPSLSRTRLYDREVSGVNLPWATEAGQLVTVQTGYLNSENPFGTAKNGELKFKIKLKLKFKIKVKFKFKFILISTSNIV